MATTYERHLKLNIDGSRVGLESGERESNYFCTPKGAKVIGWAGVDGIHYCFVRGFGEMVFAVSPRQKRTNPYEPQAFIGICVGIIGGADGPTAIIFGGSEQSKLHVVCSSLHFEPVDNVEWHMVVPLSRVTVVPLSCTTVVLLKTVSGLMGLVRKCPGNRVTDYIFCHVPEWLIKSLRGLSLK